MQAIQKLSRLCTSNHSINNCPKPIHRKPRLLLEGLKGPVKATPAALIVDGVTNVFA